MHRKMKDAIRSPDQDQDLDTELDQDPDTAWSSMTAFVEDFRVSGLSAQAPFIVVGLNSQTLLFFVSGDII